MNTNAQSHLTQKIEAEIQAIQNRFVPDSRTGIFTFHVLATENFIAVEGETSNAGALQAVQEYTKTLGVNVELKARLLPSDDIKKKYAVVSVSVANMRKNPQHAAEMVSQCLMGHVLRVYKIQQGWALIQTPDDYLGWVEDDGFVLMDEKEINQYLKSNRLLITASHPYCYPKPKETGAVVCDLTACGIVEKIGEKGAWYKVQLADKRVGYIRKKDAVSLESYFKNLRFSTTALIETAHRFTGTPYLWGGTSAKGLDCSGFTKTVFFLNGYILSRDASQQVLQGDLVDTTINLTKMQPGDLQFYGKLNQHGVERATHVGLYIGGGEFIHESGRVRINSYDENSPVYSAYRTKMFLRAKRINPASTGNGVQKVIESPYYFPVKELQ